MNSISAVSTSGASMFASKATGGKSAADVSQFEQILKDFKAAASQTPAERAASAVLKKHGLTRDQLDRLPSAQRDAVMKEMEDAVKRVVNASTDRQKRNIGLA
jgi:truncated hemoglobin YjbI